MKNLHKKTLYQTYKSKFETLSFITSEKLSDHLNQTFSLSEINFDLNLIRYRKIILKKYNTEIK
jgi:hypothetical protein